MKQTDHKIGIDYIRHLGLPGFVGTKIVKAHGFYDGPITGIARHNEVIYWFDTGFQGGWRNVDQFEFDIIKSEVDNLDEWLESKSGSDYMYANDEETSLYYCEPRIYILHEMTEQQAKNELALHEIYDFCCGKDPSGYDARCLNPHESKMETYSTTQNMIPAEIRDYRSNKQVGHFLLEYRNNMTTDAALKQKFLDRLDKTSIKELIFMEGPLTVHNDILLEAKTRMWKEVVHSTKIAEASDALLSDCLREIHEELKSTAETGVGIFAYYDIVLMHAVSQDSSDRIVGLKIRYAVA